MLGTKGRIVFTTKTESIASRETVWEETEAENPCRAVSTEKVTFFIKKNREHAVREVISY